MLSFTNVYSDRDRRGQPRPVLGSRIALLGLGLRPLLFITSVLGGVSVGVPRFRGRALRAFWDIESGCVFTPVHRTAEFKVYLLTTNNLSTLMLKKLKCFYCHFEEPSRVKYTCCKTCLCWNRTGAFSVSIRHQGGGKAHQAIVHTEMVNKYITIRTNLFGQREIGAACYNNRSSLCINMHMQMETD